MRTSLGRRPAPRPSTDQTPLGWRLAAATLLVGGAVAGDRLSRLPARRLVAPVGAAAAATVMTLLAGDRLSQRNVASIVPSRGSKGATAGLPALDVLVPARDEAAAIPRLIADLAGQDYRDDQGRARFRVVVVDDRSCDGTGDAARVAADTTGLAGSLSVVRRETGSLPDGKGAALAAVPTALLTGDAVVVLDADARVRPAFLVAVAARLAAGDTAFTVGRRVYHARASCLAAAQSAELDLDGMQLRARAALGGAGEFRGNGMVLGAETLALAGGWPSGALTEDLDLSTQLASLGVRVAWAAEPVAWEAPTATARALARQRLRWAEGSLRRLLALLPAALGSRRLTMAAKVDLAAYAGQALLPPVVLGAVVGGVRLRRPGPALLLVSAYVAGAVALAWNAVGSAAAEPDSADEGFAHPAAAETTSSPSQSAFDRRSVRATLGGLFATQWLVAVPVALARIALRPGRVVFDRTRDRLL